MNVSIHIDRLILDGVDVPHYHHPRLQASVTAELTRLLADGSLQSGIISSREMASVLGSDIQMPGDSYPELIGQQIARAVYGGLNS